MSEDETPGEGRDLESVLSELRELAGREGGGGPASLLALWVRIRNMARKHLPPYSSLRAGLDSEDLAQEGLLHLVRNIERFRGCTWPEFLAFAHAVVQQKVGQQARRMNVRSGEFFGEVADDQMSGEQVTPSVDAMAGEDRRRLRELMAGLPESYREPLMLRLNGHENAEIAARLGLTPVALRQRMSRAMKMLQERW
ncbi:MAG: sigma-70 family RNA polymerase sigma factor [Planctomycetes bacterium]|nr:sigma-70 family RNA polymerase sigma factor [Planctomycetota bacterium]